jgi:hypothetical protein
MAIDFTQATFGKKNSGSVGSKNDLPKAQFWINIGYSVKVPVVEAGGKPAGEEDRFVSLPVGIPLDTQEHLATNSRNEGFTAFQTARNDLLDQIHAAAKALKPGEEKILNLQIQLRRINEDAAPIAAADNPFVKKLDL